MPIIRCAYRPAIAAIVRDAMGQPNAGPKDGAVLEMRIVVTAPDFDEALTFYRDTLGLHEIGAFRSEGGRVSILDAGRATLELADPAHAAYVDEIEVGRRVAGHIRMALQVADVVTASGRLVAGRR